MYSYSEFLFIDISVPTFQAIFQRNEKAEKGFSTLWKYSNLQRIYYKVSLCWMLQCWETWRHIQDSWNVIQVKCQKINVIRTKVFLARVNTFDLLQFFLVIFKQRNVRKYRESLKQKRQENSYHKVNVKTLLWLQFTQWGNKHRVCSIHIESEGEIKYWHDFTT